MFFARFRLLRNFDHPSNRLYLEATVLSRYIYFLHESYLELPESCLLMPSDVSAAHPGDVRHITEYCTMVGTQNTLRKIHD